MKGKKYDKGKPAMDLVPFDAVEQVAAVLSFGATKYGRHNWALGMAHGRLVAAALRHIGAYLRGDDLDEESGLPHLSHAACCILMAISLIQRKVGKDDRFKVRK